MLKENTFLAIIPARGGSKRLPRKNVLDLVGKPLISWTIEAGLKSKYIDKVLVTSDDDEILSISKKKGANVLKRPGKLASDIATTFDAIKHAIDNEKKYDYIVLLQATSPLRNEKHIDEAIELLEKKNADAIISVCKTDHSPLWSNVLPDDGNMSDFIRDEVKNKQSQDLENYFRLNGALYICNTNNLLKEKSFFLNRNVFSYVMSKRDSVDIDDGFDFELAKTIIHTQHNF